MTQRFHIEYKGAFYNVASRGNARQRVLGLHLTHKVAIGFWLLAFSSKQITFAFTLTLALSLHVGREKRTFEKFGVRSLLLT